MVEEAVDSVSRLIAWLVTHALSLYYLAGFFVIVCGFILFIGALLREAGAAAKARNGWPGARTDQQVNVYVETLIVTVQLGESELRSSARHENRAALPMDTEDEDCE